MARVEDHHWWYAGLRAMVGQAWDRHIHQARPLLLDVGCGTGGNLWALRERAVAYGVDMAQEAVAACRARGLGLTARASAEALPFPDGLFDVVLSCDVLSHCAIPDERVALREMARVLRPGGTLILNLPAYGWLLSSHDRAVQQDKRYTRGQLHGLLQESGLAPASLTHWNTLLLPAAVLLRLWRRLAPAAASDLSAGSGERFDRVFRRALALERAWLRRRPLACGLSVFAVATRMPGDGAGQGQ